MFENEECYIMMSYIRLGSLWVARFDKYTTGEPASVRFDPDYAWNNRAKIIGWYHTHPHWCAYPSSTDNSTMKAQVLAVGKPLLCVIQGTDALRAWWYFDDQSPAVQGSIRKYRNAYWGIIPSTSKIAKEVENDHIQEIG